MNRFSIAIDGPAGAGKSTIAKELAKDLSCIYIDTGAMYRTVGLASMMAGKDYTQEEEVNQLLKNIRIEIKYTNGMQNIYLNGEDVSLAIRTQDVATAASKVATYSKVREALVEMQRDMQKSTSVVMDGRDIGTVVLPHATLKIFLTASAKERAERRCLEYRQKGIEADFTQILQEIEERDYQDANREVSPLKKAEDAVEIDTTSLTITDIVESIKVLLAQRLS
ncbi:MAG: (d)CMP kinase [Cellulosilyticaceae bacterium]